MKTRLHILLLMVHPEHTKNKERQKRYKILFEVETNYGLPFLYISRGFACTIQKFDFLLLSEQK